MATYYYIGPLTGGSMQTAANWSDTSGGAARPTIPPWAHGDTVVIDTDATIAHNKTTSNLNVLGSGSPIFVWNQAYNETRGSLASPIILPNCRVDLSVEGSKESGESKCYVSAKSGTRFTRLQMLASGSDAAYVTLSIASVGGAEIILLGDLKLQGPNFSLVGNDRICFDGTGDQAVDVTTNVMLDANTKLQFRKTSGAVIVTGGTRNDPVHIGGNTPTLNVGKSNGSAHAVLFSDLTVGALTLNNLVSNTEKTSLYIPSGKTLKTGTTTWNANCLLTGADTNDDGTINSFGTYDTACANGTTHDDAASPNYNVAAGVVKTCTTGSGGGDDEDLMRLDAPTDIDATPQGIRGLRVTFSGPPEAVHYRLQYATRIDRADASYVEPFSSGAVLGGLEPATTYSLCIKAIGDRIDYADSDWSEIVFATTPETEEEPPLLSDNAPLWTTHPAIFNGAAAHSADLDSLPFFTDVSHPVTLFAKIFNREDQTLLSVMGVRSITYSVYPVGPIDGRYKKGVQGHNEISVRLDALSPSLRTSDAISFGFNFRFAPDVRRSPIFPHPGRFDLVVTLSQIGNNPVVLKYRFDVIL